MGDVLMRGLDETVIEQLASDAAARGETLEQRAAISSPAPLRHCRPGAAPRTFWLSWNASAP